MEAAWVVAALYRRLETWERVFRALLDRVPGAFSDPAAPPAGVPLSELAEQVPMHASALKQIVSAANVKCPRGIVAASELVKLEEAPSLEELLRLGPSRFNQLRRAGQLPTTFPPAVIHQLEVAGVDLSGLGLAHILWEECVLEQVDFSGADLSGASLLGGRLRECVFKDAELAGARFVNLPLEHCDFAGARGLADLELEGVTLQECRGLEAYDPGD